MKADAFLNALGKDDDEDDVPRKRRTRKAADTAPPAADPTPAPPVEPTDPAPQAAAPASVPTPSQQRAAERRTVIEPDGMEGVPPELADLLRTVQDVLLPGVGPGTASDEPVKKTSVDLRWTLREGLAELVRRDRRGPKAELNEALELWLKVKGIDVPKWKG